MSPSPRLVRGQKGRRRQPQVLEFPVVPGGRLVGFPDACERLNLSQAMGRYLLQRGQFPVPTVRRKPGPKRQKLQFSSVDIDFYVSQSGLGIERRRG